MLCFLLVSELRELHNYPIFLLGLADFIVSGPGFAQSLFSYEFLRLSHVDRFGEKSAGKGALSQAYIKFNLNVRTSTVPLADLTGTFVQYCLPEVLGQRLGEYSTGLCNVILAYERYVMIVLPTQKNILLSSYRRKRIYLAATTIILSVFVTDVIIRAISGDIYCYHAPGRQIFTSKEVGEYVTNVISLFVFSIIPFCFCFCCYVIVIRALLSRKKKIGRNIHLVSAFAFSCTIWFTSFSMKLFYDSYLFTLHITQPFTQLYKYPLATNLFARRTFGMFGCVPSFFSPFILIVLLKSYRKPFLKAINRATCRKIKLFDSET